MTRGALALLAGIGIYLLLTLLGGLLPTNRDWQPSTEPAVAAYLSSSRIHVNYVFPIAHPLMDWRTLFPFEHFPAVDSSYTHIAISYGDLEFFYATPGWEGLSVGSVASAVLWPSRPALHVEYLRDVPNEVLQYQQLPLRTEEYQSLIDYLRQTIAVARPAADPRGGYRTTDNFFPVPGSYHAFNTCNNWINRGLKQAGVKTGVWSPLVWGITRWHRSPRR